MANSAPSEGSDTQKDQRHSEGRWEAIRKWFEDNWEQVLFFVGGLALYLLLGLFLWWLFQRYVDPSTIKDPSKEAAAKKDLLQTLGLVMAGVAGAFGIYFTWRGQRLAREAQEDNQRNTQQQLDIARQGQITERFTRAIELLGASNDDSSDGKRRNIEQRMGATYALEQIAGESERHHDLIETILAAYVQHNAPRVPEMPDSPEDENQSGLGHAEHDIQAILEVIGTLAEGDERFGKKRIVLEGTATSWVFGFGERICDTLAL